MKRFFFIVAIGVSPGVFCIGCAETKNANSRQTRISGIWMPVHQEMSGNPLPPAVYEKEKLEIGDTTYILTAESVDKGALRYKDGKMDIYGRDGVNAGKHFTAIYYCEKDQLTICYNLTGDSYPDSYETRGKPLYFLSVFKRAK